MNFEDKLKKIGLNQSEAVVYLYLLEQGLSTPSQVGKVTRIARTNTYHILRSLKEKGLIEEHEQHGKYAYIASDPEALLRSMDKKRAAISEMLPDLRALYTTQKHKPKIRFYDGWEQVKEIYLQTLSAQNVLAIGSTKRLVELDSVFAETYWKKARKNGIVFHDILTKPSEEKSLSKITEIFRGLHSARVLPTKYTEIPTDILIWDDHIALITLQEPIFGTILTNSLLARTFTLMFEVMWDTLHPPGT